MGFGQRDPYPPHPAVLFQSWRSLYRNARQHALDRQRGTRILTVYHILTPLHIILYITQLSQMGKLKNLKKLEKLKPYVLQLNLQPKRLLAITSNDRRE